jgi:hypothetical protein
MDTLGVGYISIRIGVLHSTNCGGGNINIQEYNDVVSWSTMILEHVKWGKGSKRWWVLQLAREIVFMIRSMEKG